MVDSKGKDEVSKLNSSSGKDAAQTVSTPATVISTSIMSSEINVVASASIGNTEEVENANDEGKAMVAVDNVGHKIDEGHNNEKAIVEEKTDQDDAIVREDEEKTEGQKNGEKLGDISKGKGRKPRKRNKKKVAQKDSEVVAVNGDKPESSSKKNSSKRVESMGMVFMCSSKTKTDCFRYKILGLPASKKDQVAKIYKGMRLFLFDVDLRLMYGIFKAAGPGGYNIEPKAFNSGFPSQVRFTVIDDCLPLAEENFKVVIKENYYARNKFECQLNAEQVKKLCKLFVVPGKGGPTPKTTIKKRRSGADESHRRGADESRRGGHREKRKRRALEEERHPPPSGARRRYQDYERPPVMYEQEAVHSAVDHVPRYQPLAPPSLAPVRSYGYKRALEMHPYVRSPVPERQTFRVLDMEPRRYEEIVSRDRDQERDPYPLYSKEPHSYRHTFNPSIGQAPEYHRAPAAALPPEYRLVSREYNPPPAVQPAEYHLSGGLQVPHYRDVGLSSEYHASAAALPVYRPHQTHYGY